MAAVVAAHEAAGEQRRGNVRGPPRRDIGEHAAIFVRTEIGDGHAALAEQIAQGTGRGFGLVQLLLAGCFQFGRIDAAQPNAHDVIASLTHTNTREKSIAIDCTDEFDGTHIRVAGLLKNDLGISGTIGLGNEPMRSMPTTGRDNWRPFARGTAAHSTLTYHDTSSCQFVEMSAMKRLLHGSPVTSGPVEVESYREIVQNGTLLTTSHVRFADGLLPPGVAQAGDPPPDLIVRVL